MDKYDYVITGSGAAGLSLLVHILDSGKFTDKKILLVDKLPKNKNDRTWCFWEKDAGLFEPVVYKKWNTVWFHEGSFLNKSSEGNASNGSALHDIFPYQYKLIRAIDFYNYCLSIIAGYSNVTVQYGNVEQCVSDGSGTYVVVGGRKIFAEYIFNSIRFGDPVISPGKHYLLQHFKGWIIETPGPVFNEAQATLMDFRITQNDDTSFVYVMPFSETRALVEFTVFSAGLLQEEAYEEALAGYCKKYLNTGRYTIIEQEFGVIPMTDHPFIRRINNIINIGTAGGQTKASSGYTFKFIQKDSKAITDALINTGRPFVAGGGFVRSILNRRFDLYDRTLLNILSNHLFPGERIFSILMKSNKMREVMKFLDNETSLAEELKIIRKLPKGIFLRAAMKSLILT
jgi:lycopene beta-cyclase